MTIAQRRVGRRQLAFACAGMLAACSSDSSSDTSSAATGAATAESAATSTSTTSASSAGSGPASSSGAVSTVRPTPDQFAFSEIAELSEPVDLTYRAGDPALYVVSRGGFIVAMRHDALDDTKLLDISGDITSGGEQGLLGLAFSADGAHAYVDYTNRGGDTEITEYAVGADGVFDPGSKRLLLKIDQPYPNHNGGQVRIGPDGYLYIGMGDGGSGGDPDRRALNVGTLLGKLLRIDPTPAGESPYSIPPDNPFVGVDGARPEIFAVGLRNPWRYSFDLMTKDLWIADVGQGAWEEVDVAWADQGGGRGANFGWSAFEGTHRFNEDQSADGVTMPIFEYDHGNDCSISGGVRYRGSALPSLTGWYIYGDYCSGEVRAFPVLDDRTAGDELTLTTLNAVSEVAQGADGEVYVLSLDGKILALQPAG